MKPTVGRTVHYFTSDGRGPFAALVVAVKDTAASLAVFEPSAVVDGRVPFPAYFHPFVAFGEPSDATRRDVWCWPLIQSPPLMPHIVAEQPVVLPLVDASPFQEDVDEAPSPDASPLQEGDSSPVVAEEATTPTSEG